MKGKALLRNLAPDTYFKTTLTGRLGIITGRGLGFGIAVDFLDAPEESKVVHNNLIVIPLDSSAVETLQSTRSQLTYVA